MLWCFVFSNKIFSMKNSICYFNSSSTSTGRPLEEGREPRTRSKRWFFSGQLGRTKMWPEWTRATHSGNLRMAKLYFTKKNVNLEHNNLNEHFALFCMTLRIPYDHWVLTAFSSLTCCLETESALSSLLIRLTCIDFIFQFEC